MATWQLSDGSTSQPLDDWGINAPQLTLRNQVPDTLKFSADRAVDQADLFSFGTTITLYKDSAVWFVGKIISSPHSGKPNYEGHDYEAVGPWAALDEIMYKQAWRNTSSTTTLKSHVILGKDSSHSSRTVGQVISAILNYAYDNGAEIDWVGAELDALTAEAIHDDCTDIMCGEAIKRMLRWYPDVVTWVDYTTYDPDSPGYYPSLHFTRRGAASAVSINCTDGALVDSLDIRSRDDLQKTGVIINYERNNTSSVYAAVFRDTWPTSPAPSSGPDTLEMTVKVSRYEQRTAVNAGIVKAIYDAVSVLQYEGSIVLAEEECSAGPRPGKVLNLAGGLASWATMGAAIQSVVFELASGKTSIAFGPPKHLGVEDFIDLLRGNRKRNTGDGIGPDYIYEDYKAALGVSTPALNFPTPAGGLGFYLLKWVEVVGELSTTREWQLIKVGAGASSSDDVQALLKDTSGEETVVYFGDLDYGT